jgi:POT family proton-dependent oligopeptide transporter
MTTITTSDNTHLKQPPGLYRLSFIELWERFGFYTVQVLLVLFLTKVRHLSDAHAYDLFSAFSALIYATPVIGGYIADRLLGYRRSVTLGAVLYLIGYCALATTSQKLFYPALALLICGNGFFKGCVSSLLGTFYESRDPRRDSGFTIFYMCFNIGGLLAPIISTWVAVTFGWGYGFGAAAIGMIIGLSSAIISFKKLGDCGEAPNLQRLTEPFFLGLSRQNLFYGALIIAILLISWLMNFAGLVDHAFVVFSAVTVIAVVIFTFRYEPVQRNKMLLLIILMAFSVFFWSLYMQMFSSITLFLDRVVDRHLFGHIIPASAYTSVSNFFILLFSPAVAALWLGLRNSRWNPSLPHKFSLGLLFLGASFLTLASSVHLTLHGGLVWQGWVVISYMFLPLGELCLSPIGLSMIISL